MEPKTSLLIWRRFVVPPYLPAFGTSEASPVFCLVSHGLVRLLAPDMLSPNSCRAVTQNRATEGSPRKHSCWFQRVAHSSHRGCLGCPPQDTRSCCDLVFVSLCLSLVSSSCLCLLPVSAPFPFHLNSVASWPGESSGTCPAVCAALSLPCTCGLVSRHSSIRTRLAWCDT